MKLTAAHRFDAPVAAVCAAMGDPEFYAVLRLPDLDPPEVVVRKAEGTHVDMHVRFVYTGKLDPIARRIVGHDHVAWVQRLVIDPDAESAALSVVPDLGVIPVSWNGTFTLHGIDGDACVRRLDGDLRIKVPIIGSRAERSLAPGITRRLDLEAEALNHFLTLAGP